MKWKVPGSTFPPVSWIWKQNQPSSVLRMNLVKLSPSPHSHVHSLDQDTTRFQFDEVRTPKLVYRLSLKVHWVLLPSILFMADINSVVISPVYRPTESTWSELNSVLTIGISGWWPWCDCRIRVDIQTIMRAIFKHVKLETNWHCVWYFSERSVLFSTMLPLTYGGSSCPRSLVATALHTGNNWRPLRLGGKQNPDSY